MRGSRKGSNFDKFLLFFVFLDPSKYYYKRAIIQRNANNGPKLNAGVVAFVILEDPDQYC